MSVSKQNTKEKYQQQQTRRVFNSARGDLGWEKPNGGDAPLQVEAEVRRGFGKSRPMFPRDQVNKSRQTPRWMRGVFNKAFLLREGRFCKLGAKRVAGTVVFLMTTAKSLREGKRAGRQGLPALRL